MTLDFALNERVTRALNVCRTVDGWQASLETKPGVFSVRISNCPAAAIREVLGLDLPPPPLP